MPWPSKSVFANDYLMRHIFSYFNTDGADQEEIWTNKKHIGLAALTCRSFSWPARHAQWYILLSLRPLFRFLEKGWDRRLYEFNFSKTEPKENIKKFHAAARKVRILWYFPANWNLHWHPISEAAIETVAKEGVIFPNLHALHCSVPGPWVDDFRLFFGRTLRHLSIYPDPNPNTLEEYSIDLQGQIRELSCMATLVATLRSLHIKLETGAVDDPLDGISSFKFITDLAVFGDPSRLTHAFLMEFSRLHHLETVRLEFNKFEDIDDQSVPMFWNCRSSTNLKRVELTGMLPGIVTFMDGLKRATLTELKIEIREDPESPSPSTEEILRLTKSMARAGTTSLKSLTVRDTVPLLPKLRLSASNQENEDSDSDEVEPSNAFIDCFLQFPNLQTLTYNADPFYLSGSEIDAIIESESWGNTLEVLAMPYGGKAEDTIAEEHDFDPPSLEQLPKLVEALVNLKTLDIYIQIGDDGIPSPIGAQEYEDSLQVLHIETQERLEQKDIIPLGEYLDHTFSQLQVIECRGKKKQREIWKGVVDIISLCRRVRKRAEYEA